MTCPADVALASTDAGAEGITPTVADCVIVTALPATKIRAVRDTPLLFGSTVNVVEPLPFPFAPAVIVTQGYDDETDDAQKHVESVVIVDVPEPPFASKLNASGDELYVHPLACAILKFTPFTLILLER